MPKAPSFAPPKYNRTAINERNIEKQKPSFLTTTDKVGQLYNSTTWDLGSAVDFAVGRGRAEPCEDPEGRGFTHAWLDLELLMGGEEDSTKPLLIMPYTTAV